MRERFCDIRLILPFTIWSNHAIINLLDKFFDIASLKIIQPRFANEYNSIQCKRMDEENDEQKG